MIMLEQRQWNYGSSSSSPSTSTECTWFHDTVRGINDLKDFGLRHDEYSGNPQDRLSFDMLEDVSWMLNSTLIGRRFSYLSPVACRKCEMDVEFYTNRSQLFTPKAALALVVAVLPLHESNEMLLLLLALDPNRCFLWSHARLPIANPKKPLLNLV